MKALALGGALCLLGCQEQVRVAEGETARALLPTLERAGVAVAREGDALWVSPHDVATVVKLAAEVQLPPNESRPLVPSLAHEHAANVRAREVELAATLSALPGVSMARVHLDVRRAEPGVDSTGRRASVVLFSDTAGVDVAARTIVASAVTELSPDAVSVRVVSPPVVRAPRLAMVGPFAVSGDSVLALRATMGVLLALLAFAAVLLLRTRGRRAA